MSKVGRSAASKICLKRAEASSRDRKSTVVSVSRGKEKSVELSVGICLHRCSRLQVRQTPPKSDLSHKEL